MLNLVLILLIHIFFYFALFFYWFFFLISSLNICLVKNLAFFIFLGFSLTGSPRFYNPGNRSEGLAWVNFRLFLKYFFNIFLIVCFCFPIYMDISISYHRSCVWFVDPSWLWVSLKAFFVNFFLLCFHKFFKLAYNKLLDRTRIQNFI
jgi:hypothetical protein